MSVVLERPQVTELAAKFREGTAEGGSGPNPMAAGTPLPPQTQGRMNKEWTDATPMSAEDATGLIREALKTPLPPQT